MGILRVVVFARTGRAGMGMVLYDREAVTSLAYLAPLLDLQIYTTGGCRLARQVVTEGCSGEVAAGALIGLRVSMTTCIKTAS